MSDDRLDPLNDLFSGISEEPEDAAPEQGTPEAQPQDAEISPLHTLLEGDKADTSGQSGPPASRLPLDLFSSDEEAESKRSIGLPTDLFSSDEVEEPVSLPERRPDLVAVDEQVQGELEADLEEQVLSAQPAPQVAAPTPSRIPGTPDDVSPTVAVEPDWARRRTLGIIGIAYLVALVSLFRGGATGTGAWYLIAIPVLCFILMGERPGIVAGAINVVLYVGFALARRLGWLAPSLPPIASSTSQMLASGAVFVFVVGVLVAVQANFVRTQRRTLRSLEEQSSRLRQAQRAGSRREEEQRRLNASLKLQTERFALGEQIGRAAAMGLGITEFSERVVALVEERTAADYVGLFLLDEDREYALLRAFAGVDQTALSAERQRLRVDDEILLRQCVSSGRAHVLIGIDEAQNLAEQGGGLFLLAETRSAITLPLVARGQVFGVVAVQSQFPSAFGNEDLHSLRAVIDQVATAVSNAQLAEELNRRLQEMATLQQYYVREAWEQFLSEEREQLYEFEQPGVASLGGRMLPEVERVLAQPELMILKEGEASAPSALVSPISLRDQVLGVLGLHRETADEPWTDDQVELIAAISEQMGLIIENSRLFAEARARATRERQAREITARMRQSLEVETVLQTAAREIGQTLRLHDVTIELTDSAMTEVER